MVFLNHSQNFLSKDFSSLFIFFRQNVIQIHVVMSLIKIFDSSVLFTSVYVEAEYVYIVKYQFYSN